MSMTSRAFCGDPRKYFALALASIIFCPRATAGGSDYALPHGRATRPRLCCRRCCWRASASRRDLRSLLCLRSRVPLECTRGRELAELVSDHVLSNVDQNVAFALMHSERQANHVRRNRRTPRPGANHLRPLSASANALDRLANALVDPGSFFN